MTTRQYHRLGLWVLSWPILAALLPTSAQAQVTVDSHNLVSGTSSSSPYHFDELDGHVYFNADTSGPEEIYDFLTPSGPPVALNGADTPFIVVAGPTRVFFRGTSSGDTDLWQYNPAAAPGAEFSEIELNATGSSDPVDLTLIGSQLFVSADGGSGVGREMFVVDADNGSVVQTCDIASGATSADPRDFVELDGLVYFVASSNGVERELHSYAGTCASIVEIDLNGVDPAGASPSFLTPLGPHLYFRAHSNTSGVELFQYQTSPPLATVVPFVVGEASSDPTGFVVVDDLLFLTVTLGSSGRELVIVDDTEAIATPVEIFPGATGSFPTGFTRLGDFVYFAATGNDGAGEELFRLALADYSFERISDLNTAGSGAPHFLTALGDFLIFRATATEGDQELWSYDSVGNAFTQHDLNSDTSSSWPIGFFATDSQVFLNATNATIGRELFVVNVPVSFCGDGVLDEGEQCDDGDTNDNDSCTNSCTNAECGDGSTFDTEGGTESCDTAGESATCDNDCTFPACNDGIFNDDAEVCDTGGNTAGCDADCTLPACLDGVFNSVGSSRVDLQACKLEYSIVSPK